MRSYAKLLYKAIRCGYVLGLHGTSPDLSCTPAAPLFAAPLQQKLEMLSERHFKPFQNKCEAMQKAFI